MKAKKQRRERSRIVLSVLKASPRPGGPKWPTIKDTLAPSQLVPGRQSIRRYGRPPIRIVHQLVRGADQFLAPNQRCLALHLCEYRRAPGHNLKLANLKGARLALAELRLA
jgi:hypothetical protein